MRITKLLITPVLIMACTTGKCREQKDQKQETTQAPAAKVESTSPKSVVPPAELATTQPGTRAAPSVRVFKYDGSKQCGEGPGVSLDDMEKQLKGIKIISKEKSNDGKMRPQVCGADTGEINVYKITPGDLAKALKAGFKELK